MVQGALGSILEAIFEADFQPGSDGYRPKRSAQDAVARRIRDGDVMDVLEPMLRATGKKGVPQGGVISPLRSNIDLNEVDRMLERAKEVTRDASQMNKRTALLRRLEVVVRQHASKPVDQVIERVDPILRGWAKGLDVGYSSRCVDHVRKWVEREIRRRQMRACHRRDFDREMWSRRWLHDGLGLFGRVPSPKDAAGVDSAPRSMGPMALGAKQAG